MYGWNQITNNPKCCPAQSICFDLVEFQRCRAPVFSPFDLKLIEFRKQLFDCDCDERHSHTTFVKPFEKKKNNILNISKNEAASQKQNLKELKRYTIVFVQM